MASVAVGADRRIGTAADGYATMMGQTFPWFVIS